MSLSDIPSAHHGGGAVPGGASFPVIVICAGAGIFTYGLLWRYSIITKLQRRTCTFRAERMATIV